MSRNSMPCPICLSPQTIVVDTEVRKRPYVHRRRKCVNGHRFTTHEVWVEEPDWSNWVI